MVESVLRRVHAGQYGELMTSAWISTNWVAEQKSSLTLCWAKCGVFVSFGEISSGRCTDTVPQRRIHVRSWQVVSAAAKRRLGFIRLDLYGASIASLQSLLDEIGILTHIDVLIVPSMSLHSHPAFGVS